MGSGISRQFQFQNQKQNLNKNETETPTSIQIPPERQQSGLTRIFSEPILPSFRENTDEQAPVNQQIGGLAKITSSPDLIANSTNPPNNPIGVRKASSKIVMSPPISQLTFQVGERNYILEKANSRKKSWKEIELAVFISKPFTGNVRSFPVKKYKLKNVRTVTVTSPPKT